MYGDFCDKSKRLITSMAAFWKLLFLLSWLCYLFISAILLFTHGFLLKRDVIPEISTCEFQNTNVRYNEVSQTFQVEGNKFKHKRDEDIVLSCTHSRIKVVLIIVDAFKFDFAFYNSSINKNKELAYQNKLTTIRFLLQHKPKHAKLYKFIADPPTTTMQRLKGITTGSLPTFIDIGSNFATYEINEDNVLDQVRGKNGNIVFMGDDTWTGLYPKRFLREYPFSSFNVWDLDTVDKGVTEHLFPELKRDDWQLLIAHYLGIDHCGHRYGPNHPEMARKLNELNKVLKTLVDTIDENTVLFVVGDHGMTKTGDHGGDSEAEVTAAMFVYSPGRLLSDELGWASNSVSQVDLVPTLATVLGIPIPFSNLGTLIPEVLPTTGSEGDDWRYALEAVRNNVHQIHKYILTYSETSSQLPQQKLSRLKNIYEHLMDEMKEVSNVEEFKHVVQDAREYMAQVKDMCSEVWVQFDASTMFWGLVFMTLAILLSFIVVEGVSRNKLAKIISGKLLGFAYFTTILTAVGSVALQKTDAIGSSETIVYFSTTAVSMCILTLVLVRNFKAIISHIHDRCGQDWHNIVVRGLMFFSACGVFSNSYVVEESTILSYFLTTVTVLLVFNYKPEKDMLKNKHKWWNMQTAPRKLRLLFLVLIFNVFLRMSHHYWKCREEQEWCDSSVVQKSSFFSMHGKYGNVKYLATLISLALFVTVCRMWLRSCGNLVGFSSTVMLVRYIPTVMVVCMCVFWALHGLPKYMKSHLEVWQQQLIAWIIYGLLGITLTNVFIKPLCIFVVPKDKDQMTVYYGQENIIPHLYNHLKESMQRQHKVADGHTVNTPIVYGLATVYSAALVVLNVMFILLTTLLLGDVLAPSAVLMFMSSVILAAILSIARLENSSSIEQMLQIPWSTALTWGFLSLYYFYGTSHQPTFPSIQWDAAFIGTGGEFSTHLIPAFLIGTNTFTSQIASGLMLPLVVVLPFTLLVMFPKLVTRENVKDDLKRGEIMLFEREDLFSHSLFDASMKFIMFHAIRVFACMLAAAVHCRHLMVWKIFAPKFIFEGLGLFATIPAIILSLLLMARVTCSLSKLMKSIEAKEE